MGSFVKKAFRTKLATNWELISFIMLKATQPFLRETYNSFTPELQCLAELMSSFKLDLFSHMLDFSLLQYLGLIPRVVEAL